MRSARELGGLAACLGGGAALVICCALGPAAVVGGIAAALGGLGVGSWLLAAGGIALVLLGLGIVWQRRRAARCPPAEPTTR